MIDPEKMRIWNAAYLVAQRIHELTAGMPQDDTAVHLLRNISTDMPLTIALWTFVGVGNVSKAQLVDAFDQISRLENLFIYLTSSRYFQFNAINDVVSQLLSIQQGLVELMKAS